MTHVPAPPKREPPNRPGPRVLVAEDDGEMRRLLVEVLEADGYEVVQASSGFQFYEQLQRWADSRTWPTDETPGLALVVSDIRMPGLSGMEVLRLVAEELPSLPFVVITAFADDATRREAERLRVAGFLSKPFDLHDLESTIAGAMASGARRTTSAQTDG